MGGLLGAIPEWAFCGVPATYSTLSVANGLWEKWREIMELFDIWGCTRHTWQQPEKMLPPVVDPCQPGRAQACLYLADFFPAPPSAMA